MMPNLEPLEISLGETILFALLACCMVLCAIYGLLIARKAVYTIISVLFIMVGLAFIYTMLEAPFMGVAQVVVYTGAILMMFLFVLMLIGVDSADSRHETLPAPRPVAILGGTGILFVLAAVVWTSTYPKSAGLAAANAETNPFGVARLIFSNHILTLELTGTLLIIAALGAMTLTHRQRINKRITQADLAEKKIKDFIEQGEHPGIKPNAGVYAESNSSTNPALTAYGEPLEGSVNRILQIRGQSRSVEEISPETVARISAGQVPSGPATYGVVGRSTLPGMPGEKAPVYPAEFAAEAEKAGAAEAEEQK
ncbi:NADH-quinone oxidoreductase subunit J [uncultured Arcanobacterium sp.]|uniref:NADH-quinone oxidoreductase subunit J n=1 Tax=uncultured Arcanobacterium sp. TaxID=487520 RepID=UPI002615C36E|nr:NADH-quinone oxidoreductase subunit J [uncultured Arcanobacterium sp.]